MSRFSCRVSREGKATVIASLTAGPLTSVRPSVRLSVCLLHSVFGISARLLTSCGTVSVCRGLRLGGEVCYVRFHDSGFLSTGDSNAPGNCALLDQVAALHWIQENIRPFGGNPDDVTLLGHGVGAALVNLLMTSPVTTGQQSSL